MQKQNLEEERMGYPWCILIIVSKFFAMRSARYNPVQKSEKSAYLFRCTLQTL